MTLRDEIWDKALIQAATGEFVTKDIDVPKTQRQTAKRVLREMESMDWLARDSPRAHTWRAGPKFQLITKKLDIEN